MTAVTLLRDDVIRVGDYVRDLAGMGGKVLHFWQDWAGVEWNNGQSGWIQIKWLTKQPRHIT